MARLATLLAFLTVAGASGCSTKVDVVACATSAECPAGAQCVAGRCDAGDLGLGDQSMPFDAGSPDADADGGMMGFCDGRGPLILPGTSTSFDRCTGQIAQKAFRFAVCSCGEFSVSNTFSTDSFDSRDGAYDAATALSNGAFGTNGSVTLRAPASVGGAAWVAGASGIAAESDAPLLVDRTLRVAGPVNSAAAVTVSLDADVNGDLTATNLTIGGTLTQPGGAIVTATTESIGGQASGAVSVDDPCACGADATVDPAARVAQFSDLNDNGEAGFDPSVLDGHADGAVVELPCGRLYAPTINGAGALTLRVNGRTALFVGGDMQLQGDFRVEVSPGAELDLFLEGNLTSPSRLDLGSVDTPAAVRLYVGGTQPIALSGGGFFAGYIYAPHAPFTMSAAIEIYGGLFANGIAASDTLTVHYDESIVERADDCSPPSECNTCDDCGGQACNGGTCGACASDADCCAPLQCFQGTCAPPFG